MADSEGKFRKENGEKEGRNRQAATHPAASSTESSTTPTTLFSEQLRLHEHNEDEQGLPSEEKQPSQPKKNDDNNNNKQSSDEFHNEEEHGGERESEREKEEKQPALNRVVTQLYDPAEESDDASSHRDDGGSVGTVEEEEKEEAEQDSHHHRVHWNKADFRSEESPDGSDALDGNGSEGSSLDGEGEEGEGEGTNFNRSKDSKRRKIRRTRTMQQTLMEAWKPHVHRTHTMQETMDASSSFLEEHGGPPSSRTRSAFNLHPSIRSFLDILKEVPQRLVFKASPYGSRWAQDDLAEYRDNYPGKSLNNLGQKANLRFYSNEIKSRPHGNFIDAIHTEWLGDYQLLEVHHGYVQWLFPIHEPGMNSESQVLQRHEAEAMRSSPEIRRRILKSYRLMLDFYGFQMLDDTSGELARSPNYSPRFYNLNTSPHNYLRVTRILKFLGEMNLEELKAPLLVALMKEVICEQELLNISRSLSDYWIPTLKSDADREALLSIVDRFSKCPPPSSQDRGHNNKDVQPTPFSSSSSSSSSSGFKGKDVKGQHEAKQDVKVKKHEGNKKGFAFKKK